MKRQFMDSSLTQYHGIIRYQGEFFARWHSRKVKTNKLTNRKGPEILDKVKQGCYRCTRETKQRAKGGEVYKMYFLQHYLVILGNVRSLTKWKILKFYILYRRIKAPRVSPCVYFPQSTPDSNVLMVLTMKVANSILDMKLLAFSLHLYHFHCPKFNSSNQVFI